MNICTVQYMTFIDSFLDILLTDMFFVKFLAYIIHLYADCGTPPKLCPYGVQLSQETRACCYLLCYQSHSGRQHTVANSGAHNSKR